MQNKKKIIPLFVKKEKKKGKGNQNIINALFVSNA